MCEGKVVLVCVPPYRYLHEVVVQNGKTGTRGGIPAFHVRGVLVLIK